MTEGSRLFNEQIGQPIAQGVADGIVENADKVSDALEKAIENAKGRAVAAAHDMVEEVNDALDGFWKGIDAGRSLDDMNRRIADGEQAVADASAAIVKAQQDIAAATDDEERAKATKDLTSATKRYDDAVESLKDSYYAKTKATQDDILVDDSAREAWIKTAEQAGLNKLQIEGLIDAYYRLAAAKAAEASANAATSTQADRANLIRSDFEAAVRQGLVGKPELDAINSYASNPGLQVEEMARRLGMIQQFIGAPVKSYDAAVSAAPSVDPVAWARQAADAFAKRMEQNRRAM